MFSVIYRDLVLKFQSPVLLDWLGHMENKNE
jgi:hypothetical protein